MTVRSLLSGILAALLITVSAGAQPEVSSTGDRAAVGGDDDTDSSEDELFDDGLDELLDGTPDDGPTEGSERDEGWISPLTGLKGYLEFRPRTFVRDRSATRRNDLEFVVEGELEIDLRFGQSMKGYVRPRLWVDAYDHELRRFEPYEGYVDFEGEDWDVRIGQFVENWGIVDTFNPIDVVNRRDFATGFLDPRRLGELGARARALFSGNGVIGEPTLSIYALPVWRETRFYSDDHRFSFAPPGGEFLEDQGREPTAEERGLYAARLTGTVSTEPVNADLQILLARGPDRLPLIVGDGAGNTLPVYFGAAAIGAGFRAVLNRDWAGHFLSTLTLKTEVVYKNPYAFRQSGVGAPEDYTAFVFGVDRQFNDVLRERDRLLATIEYASEWGDKDLAARQRLFRDDLILRLRWDANDLAGFGIETRAIYDVETRDAIFELAADRRLREIDEDIGVRLEVQWFEVRRSGGSLLGLWPDNTNVALGVRWSF